MVTAMAARRLAVGSILQRAWAAAAEYRRRLRLRPTTKGAGEDITSRTMEDRLAKWEAGWKRFERWDAEFTKTLNGAIVLFSVYAILSSRDLLDEMERAKADTK